eukprot:3940745-Rhodomonas_salina.20
MEGAYRPTRLLRCYALASYARAMRCAVLTQRMVVAYRMSSTDLPCADPMGLCPCYAMPGIDLAYAATRTPFTRYPRAAITDLGSNWVGALSSYALSMLCPVYATSLVVEARGCSGCSVPVPATGVSYATLCQYWYCPTLPVLTQLKGAPYQRVLVLPPYAAAMQCPVVTWRMLLPGGASATLAGTSTLVSHYGIAGELRYLPTSLLSNVRLSCYVCCAMSGTELCYAATSGYDISEIPTPLRTRFPGVPMVLRIPYPISAMLLDPELLPHVRYAAMRQVRYAMPAMLLCDVQYRFRRYLLGTPYPIALLAKSKTINHNPRTNCTRNPGSRTPISLWSCSAMSGTELGYGSTVFGIELGCAPTKCGTDLVYGPTIYSTKRAVLSCVWCYQGCCSSSAVFEVKVGPPAQQYHTSRRPISAYAMLVPDIA